VLKKYDLNNRTQSNFRPVSNITFAAKVLERLAACRLAAFIESTNSLDKYQSAYRSNFSTETAITKVVSDIAAQLDQNHSVILIALDVSAAFDTVQHNILLSRLTQSGVSGTALNWFSSYLSGREQIVCYNDDQSSSMKLTSGVPQGSVLGPLLFNLYMAPLGKYLTSVGIPHHIYADDILVYARNDQISLTLCQKALDYIEKWMAVNYLSINASKTQCLLLCNKRENSTTVIPELTLCGEKLKIMWEGLVKYLGMHIDP
jgi:retron-type reverse transcriptase